MRSAVDEDDLAGAFVGGEPDALRNVYERHAGLVHTFCRRTLRPEDAAEVTQEVFVAAWRSRERFDPASGTLAGWLVGIARHKAVDHLRAQARRPVPASDGVAARNLRIVVDDENIDRIATRLLVADALEQLPEPTREAIRLAFLEGLTHEEVAERCDLPLGTAKSTIRRGLARLRRQLEGFDAADR